MCAMKIPKRVENIYYCLSAKNLLGSRRNEMKAEPEQIRLLGNK